MTKATAIHIAVLLLCSNAAVAAAEAEANANANPAPQSVAASPSDTTTDEIQKVVIVSTGSRGSQRTVIDTPVPIDILSSRELTKSGQTSLDKALGFRVPSFNTVQTPVNDATSLMDPYEIRNMGPSRALILINGKRKNPSALIYTQTSPGRGESGSDIAAIPADAIKRIEVVRDGASAQYGSDAIAGVVNIILKDSPNEGAVTLRYGRTGEGDGRGGGVSLNHGISLDGRGFLNYTVESSEIDLANRPGKVNAAGEAADFGATVAEVQNFLNQYPDARNVNGSPKTRANKVLVNAGFDFDDNSRAYGNVAYISKNVFSFANFRTPYWRPTDFGLLTPAGTTYAGYGPTFNGKLQDYNATGGVKSTVSGWSTDVSFTVGGNRQLYSIDRTLNRGLGAASPTAFKVGGSEFEHSVFNADFSKQVFEKASVYFGTEARWESYETLAGEEASYVAGGADSFAGNDPRNSFRSDRRNYGVYAGTLFDVSDKMMVDAIGRYEKYSDFGNAFVWKLSSRYKVSEALTLRGSLSTGFRAPSLHQIFTQKAQYSFVPGSGIQVSGLFQNDSPVTRFFGQGPLDPEKSRNLTLGLGWKPDRDTSVTLDYYNIQLKDRIVLGKEIGKTGNAADPIDIALTNLGVVSASFFTNAIDTKTSGLDVVLSRKNLSALGGKMGLNLSSNYTFDNELDGPVRNTQVIANSGQSVFDATQESLLLTSRPKHKTILGVDLDYNKVNFSLNNTVFGPTTFRQAGLDANLSTKFKTKTVTDFAVNYQVTDTVTLTFNINNVFDVTPKWEFKPLNAAGEALLASTSTDAFGRTPRQVQSDLITFNGRYSMVTYDGSQFSQLGRMFNMAANFRF